MIAVRTYNINKYWIYLRVPSVMQSAAEMFSFFLLLYAYNNKKKILNISYVWLLKVAVEALTSDNFISFSD